MTAPASAPFPAPSAVLGKAYGENFPVAWRLLRRAQRRHLLAIYGFARLADELGDEASGDRLALLDELESELDRVYAGSPRHPLLQRLVPTVRELGLPDAPFRRLIEANRRDQSVRRYPTFEALRGYCELSATPVGLLVLHVFRAATPERIDLSDAICTALQLAEHWQDVAEDLARDRVYLPAEDLTRFGCTEADLGAATARPAIREMMRFEVGRARLLLLAGTPLLNALAGRARLAVAGFVAGGHAALDGIERCGYDVLGRTPRTRRRDFARHLLRLAV